MNRRDFLKTFACAAASIPVTGEILEQKTPFLLEFTVAGYQYYDGTKFEAFIREGEQIHLIREPDNRFDDNAVAVYFKHIKLGYVPRINNTVIVNLIDSGCKITGIISDIYKYNPTWERIWIKLNLEC
jgi:hypothetical protein